MPDDALPASEALPRKGQILAGKYVVEAELGRGGMGVVVAARHLQTGGVVALKLLRGGALASPQRAGRLLREARAVCRLRGEHVARLFDVDVSPDGVPFLVLERLVGDDLAAALKARGPQPFSEAVDLLLQACEGLAEAHAAGIVHRDLKPENLYLHRLPDGSISLKILDFGISRLRSPGLDEATLTGSSGVVGTPPYLAPEQVRDPHGVDARADLWSLGVVFFRMLTNRLPFGASHPSGLLAAVVADPASRLCDLLPEAPPSLDQAIASCLEKDPAARCPSVLALARQIAPEGSTSALASLLRIEALASSTGVVAANEADPSPGPDRSATLDPTTADPTADPVAAFPPQGELVAPLTFEAEPSSLARSGPTLAPSGLVALGSSPAGDARRGLAHAGWVAAPIVALVALAARALWPLASTPAPPSAAAPPAAPAALVASTAPATSAPGPDAPPQASSVGSSEAAKQDPPGPAPQGARSVAPDLVAPPNFSVSATPALPPPGSGEQAPALARPTSGLPLRGGRPAKATTQPRQPVDDERTW